MTPTAPAPVSASRIDPIVRRLEAHNPLGAAREKVVRGLSGPANRHPAGSELYAEGQIGAEAVFVLKGWAACQRILGDGRRQIFRLVLPGDIIGLEAGRGPPGWSVAALTPLETISATPVLDTAMAGAIRVARAIAMGVRQEERLLLDQLVRIGRLSGQERVAHLLLELRDRLEVVGLSDGRRFPLPLTQDVVGDTLGLSAIHVNRVFKSLRQAGLFEVRAGVVTLLRPADLAMLAGRPERADAAGSASDPSERSWSDRSEAPDSDGINLAPPDQRP